MRKLLLAAVVLASPTHAAERVKLPDKMFGTWCIKKRAAPMSTYVHDKCTMDNFDVTIMPDGYEGRENTCETTKITLKNGTYQLQYHCFGEGWVWNEEHSMRLADDGTLVIVLNRRWGEKRDKQR